MLAAVPNCRTHSTPYGTLVSFPSGLWALSLFYTFCTRDGSLLSCLLLSHARVATGIRRRERIVACAADADGPRGSGQAGRLAHTLGARVHFA